MGRDGILVFFAATSIVCLALWTVPGVQAWGSNKERILLKEVSALTLEHGKMTTGRRSSPVQQLQCVGGSAGCSYGIQPRTVQCLNRGFDGYDVQWECKAELDSKYQFGKIQVSCEGYDYPDDPYILRGSCGLEYELELTQHGEDSRYHGNYHRDDGHQSYSDYNYSQSGGRRSWSWGGLLALAVMAFVFYQILKACFGGGHHARQGTSTTGSSYSGSQSHSAPPPSGTGGGGGGGWGGFWSGAATGGALGYLFGNRGRGYGGYGGGWGGGYGGYGGSYGPSWGGGYTRGHSTGWSSGWSSSRRSGSSFGGGGGGSRSSSSRTTSGFGGTSRR